MSLLYHLTAKDDFKLNPKYRPTNNTTMGGEWPEPGIFLSDNVEHWVNGYGYWQPWVVEFEVPSGVGKQFGGSETFVPATEYDRLRITRVLPLDAYCREEFGDYGWTEQHFGTDFETGETLPVDEARSTYSTQYERLPSGWRYSGDARRMDPSWKAAYKKRVRAFARTRTNALGSKTAIATPSTAAEILAGPWYHGTDLRNGADLLNRIKNAGPGRKVYGPGLYVTYDIERAFDYGRYAVEVKVNTDKLAVLGPRGFDDDPIVPEGDWDLLYVPPFIGVIRNPDVVEIVKVHQPPEEPTWSVGSKEAGIPIDPSTGTYVPAAMNVRWRPESDEEYDTWIEHNHFRDSGNFCLDHGFAKKVEMEAEGYHVFTRLHHNYGEPCEVCFEGVDPKDPRADTIAWEAIRRSAGAGTYWRIHPEGRSFADATSTPFQGGETQSGFSCWPDPWTLWSYMMVTWAAGGTGTIIEFTGQQVGVGNDGEPLVMPERIVRSIDLDDFERFLTTQPLPAKPFGFPTWQAFLRTYQYDGEPAIDHLRATAAAAMAYRGFYVLLRDKQAVLPLLRDLAQGNTTGAVEATLRAMASGKREAWWTEGPSGDADEGAGTWWTTHAWDADTYSQSSGGFGFPVVLTSRVHEAWGPHGGVNGQEHYYRLPSGVPVEIVSAKVTVPDPDTARMLLTLIEHGLDLSSYQAGDWNSEGDGIEVDLPLGRLPKTAAVEGLTFKHKEPKYGAGIVMAFLDGKHVAGAHYSLPLSFDPPNRLYISSIEVAAEHRRKGIATALMDYLLGLYPGMYLGSGDKLPDGRRWWPSLGDRLKSAASLEGITVKVVDRWAEIDLTAVAFDGDEPVGAINVYPKAGLVNKVFVAKDRRRQGIASLLYRAVEAEIGKPLWSDETSPSGAAWLQAVNPNGDRGRAFIPTWGSNQDWSDWLLTFKAASKTAITGVIPWRVRHQGPINLNAPRPVVLDPMAVRDFKQVLHQDEQKEAREAIQALERGKAKLEPKRGPLDGVWGIRVDEDCRLLVYPHVDGAWHAFYIGRHDYDQATSRWAFPADMPTKRVAMPVGPPPSGVRYLVTWNNAPRIPATRAYCMLGAFLGDDMIGYMTWGLQGRKIQSVWVAPEYRRRRIAEKMLHLAREVDPGIVTHVDRTDAGDAWSQAVFPDVPEREHNTTEGEYDDARGKPIIKERLLTTDPRDAGVVRDITALAKVAFSGPEWLRETPEEERARYGPGTFLELDEEDDEPRFGTTGTWYHGTWRQVPIGTILTGANQFGIPNFRYEEGTYLEPWRANNVWITPGTMAALDWAEQGYNTHVYLHDGEYDKDLKKHRLYVYQVEPMGSVREGNGDFCVERAKVIREVTQVGHRRIGARTPTLYRGVKVTLPEGLRKTIDRLMEPPMEVEEIDRHKKVGALIIAWLQDSHWDTGLGLGRHWTTRREMAYGAAMQGGRGNLGIILVGHAPESSIDHAHTNTTELSAKYEDEITLLPGAEVTITDVQLPWSMGHKDGLIEAPIHARASQNELVPLR